MDDIHRDIWDYIFHFIDSIHRVLTFNEVTIHFELILVPADNSLQPTPRCSGRKRTSVLKNVLGHTMSDTITVLNYYLERQTVISPYSKDLE